MGPEPPRARCWQALGSGAARSALSLAFPPSSPSLPPLPSPPLLPPPSLDVRSRPQPRGTRLRTESPLAGGGVRGGAVDPRDLLGLGWGWGSPGSRGPEDKERKVLIALSNPPALGVRTSRRAWAWRGPLGRGPSLYRGGGGCRGGVESATFVCLLFTTDVHLNPPSLAALPPRDSLLPALKDDRHAGQPSTEPRFCRTQLATPLRVPESSETAPAFPLARYRSLGFRRPLFRLAQPAPDCSGIVLFTSLFGEPLPGIQDHALFIFSPRHYLSRLPGA